jgi:hypothetical protein
MPHTPCVAPLGVRHCRPAQQSAAPAHVPPAALHVGPPSGAGGGGSATGTQVPASWPATIEHPVPAQQSLDDVQTPDFWTQVGPVAACGWHFRTPCASGKHGVPPQHSDENVHCAPAAMQHGALPV